MILSGHPLRIRIQNEYVAMLTTKGTTLTMIDIMIRIHFHIEHMVPVRKKRCKNDPFNTLPLGYTHHTVAVCTTSSLSGPEHSRLLRLRYWKDQNLSNLHPRSQDRTCQELGYDVSTEWELEKRRETQQSWLHNDIVKVFVVPPERSRHATDRRVHMRPCPSSKAWNEATQRRAKNACKRMHETVFDEQMNQ